MLSRRCLPRSRIVQEIEDGSLISRLSWAWLQVQRTVSWPIYFMCRETRMPSGDWLLLASYCASKGAVSQLTRQIALDYAPHKIYANALCPGCKLPRQIAVNINADSYGRYSNCYLQGDYYSSDALGGIELSPPIKGAWFTRWHCENCCCYGKRWC